MSSRKWRTVCLGLGGKIGHENIAVILTLCGMQLLFSNFSGDLGELSLQIGHGWVIPIFMDALCNPCPKLSIGSSLVYLISVAPFTNMV